MADGRRVRQPRLPLRGAGLESGEKTAVAAAEALLERAVNLKADVSLGEYSDEQLVEFWAIIGAAIRTLAATPADLAERSKGLSPDFFQSVVRDRRSPKFPNMLKALTAVVEVARDRLSDVGGATPAQGWVANPLIGDRIRIESLEKQLRDLIEILQGSNSLRSDGGSDEYWRRNLIQTLETVLALLKAPLVEKSLVKKAASAAGSLGKKMPEQFSSGFWGSLAEQVSKALTDMLP